MGRIIPEWTGYQVPAHLQTKPPTNFQNKGLELGLHHCTLIMTKYLPPSSQPAHMTFLMWKNVHAWHTVPQLVWDHVPMQCVHISLWGCHISWMWLFKYDITCDVHSKLATRKCSWDQFVRDIVGDVDRAKGAYLESFARFTDVATSWPCKHFSLLSCSSMSMVEAFSWKSLKPWMDDWAKLRQWEVRRISYNKGSLLSLFPLVTIYCTFGYGNKFLLRM
jgi:hypothetical protein